VLIYSQFTRTLDILEEWVVGRRWGFERIDGESLGSIHVDFEIYSVTTGQFCTLITSAGCRAATA